MVGEPVSFCDIRVVGRAGGVVGEGNERGFNGVLSVLLREGFGHIRIGPKPSAAGHYCIELQERELAAQVIFELLLPDAVFFDEAAFRQLFQKLVILVDVVFLCTVEVLHHRIPRGPYSTVAYYYAQLLLGQGQLSQPNTGTVFQTVDVIVVVAIEIDVT